MSYRIIQVNTKISAPEAIHKIAESYPVEQFWELESKEEIKNYYFLVDTDLSQKLLDAITSITGHDSEAKVIVSPVEAVLPKPSKEAEQEREHQKKQLSCGISREELYEDVKAGANLNSNYIFLLFFSTLVAGVGLIQDSPAIVIGAMVIAPMLGPNLALALSNALADFDLSKKAIITNFFGISSCLAGASIMGYFLDVDLESHELMSRTHVEMNAILLALASGAAGVLSLTSGVSSVLVGVMVAVALLPPAVVAGLTFGAGHYDLAWGALILLFVNIVCINIAANLVFLFKGIAPRNWYKKEEAKKKVAAYMVLWFVLLALLMGLVYYRNYVFEGEVSVKELTDKSEKK